jgi:hypothetical protein
MSAVSPEELIQINHLLIEREAAFARVHTLEQAIHKLLGAEYPLPAPPAALPSTLHKKATKAKKNPTPTSAVKGPKARRLADGEVAYRVSWRENGEPRETELTDLRSLEPIIEESLPAIRLLSITTIDIDGHVMDTLYARTIER